MYNCSFCGGTLYGSFESHGGCGAPWCSGCEGCDDCDAIDVVSTETLQRRVASLVRASTVVTEAPDVAPLADSPEPKRGDTIRLPRMVADESGMVAERDCVAFWLACLAFGLAFGWVTQAALAAL